MKIWFSHMTGSLSCAARFSLPLLIALMAAAGPVEAQTRPAKPTGLTATPGNGEVVLSWNNPNDSSITGWEYQLFGRWMPIPDSNANTTTHTVKDLSNRVAHTFRVRAVEGQTKKGAASDRVTATPSAPPLMLSMSSLTVAEGGTASYTVQLGSQPPKMESGAQVWITSSNDDVTTSPASLDFTSGDWNMTKTVTVTAARDDDTIIDMAELKHVATGGRQEGDHVILTVTVTEDTAPPPVEPNPVDPNPSPPPVEDDDQPSLVVSESSLSLEEGSSGSYTVSLGAAPSGAVTVAIAVSDGAGVAVSPTSLRFSTDDWDRAQTLRVTALEDDDIADASGALSHSASGGGYDGVSAEISVTVADTDQPSLVVSESSLSLEEGSSGSYTVSLGAAPSGAVTVAIAVSDGAGVAVSPTSLRFSTDDWDRAQTLRVTALEDDDIADASGALSHSASGGGYDGVSAEISVTVADTDQPSLVVSESSLSLEEGSSGSYTVSLGAAPSGAVTVAIAVSDGAGVAVSPTSLRFSTDDWDRAQTLRVTALEDDDIADASGALSHSASGGGYDGVSAEISVTVADTDQPSLVVSESSLSLEEGSSGSYTVSLGAAPSGAVTVAIAVSDGAGVAVSPTSLRFSTDDWDRAQTLRVTALEDDDIADASGALSHSASGGGYDGVSAEISVTVADTDQPSLVVSESSLSLEEGSSGSYTVSLGAAPSGAVTVAIAVSDGAGVAVSPTSLRFSTDDWDRAQTLRVTALEDDDIADASGALSHSASGGGYDGVSAEISVTVADTDQPSLVVSESSLSLEEGSSGSYTVSLGAAPSGAVTVAIAVSDGAGVAVSPTSLRFSTDDWDRAQTLRVTALEDDDIADASGALSHSASGGGYDGVSAEISVTVADTDQPSLVVSESSLSLEEGSSGSYTVSLGAAPSGAVTVAIAVSDGAGVAVSPTSLRFSTDDWDRAQTLRVTALEDDDIADASGALSHSASGGGYDGVSAEISVTVADTDHPSASGLSDASDAWMPRFGRVVSEHILEGIGDRVATQRIRDQMRPRKAGGTSFEAVFAGRSLGAGGDSAAQSPDAGTILGDIAGSGYERPLVSSLEPASFSGGTSWVTASAPLAGAGASEGSSFDQMMRTALAGSSFTAGGTTERGSAWGLWGRGSVTVLDGHSGAVSVDGDVATGQVGADLSLGRRWLVGLSLSRSQGDGDYVGALGRGEMESTMTALTPYLSTATDRFSAWGALSLGWGDRMLRPERGAAVDTDIDMEMGAAGVRSELMSFGEGVRLSLLSDAMAMRVTSEVPAGLPLPKTDAEVSRIRAAVEASWTRQMEDGGQVSARIEGGVRRDGGDAEEGFGGEVSAGASLMRDGLTFELEGRHLVTHEDDEFSQTGASAYLAWDPWDAGGLGPSVSLRQQWGIDTSSGLDQMFAMRHMDHFGMESSAGGLDAEFGWGLPLFGGRYLGTPFLLHGAQGGGSLQTLGWRLKPLDGGRASMDASMTFKLMRHVGIFGEDDRGLSLEARLGF